jgi:hypothetical protein
MTFDVYYISRDSDAVIYYVILQSAISLCHVCNKKGYNKTDEVLLGERDTQTCCLYPLWTQYDKFIFHIVKTRCF